MARAAALLAPFFLAGCMPPWTVVTQEDPSPLLGITDYDLADPGFANLVVGNDSEADYLARQDAEKVAAWGDDKGKLAARFRAAATREAARCGVKLVPPGGPGQFTVAPAITFIEPGFYGGLVSESSTVMMTLSVTHAGKTVDEVTFSHSTYPASGGNGIQIPIFPSVTMRLEEDGSGLGQIAGQYLCSRFKGK